MNIIKPNRICVIAFSLAIPLVLITFAAGSETEKAEQKSSNELLLDIMDLHGELVTNETFLAQAKMLGAYLESAQPQEEAKKIKIYGKVLDILTKIKESCAQIPLKHSHKEGDIEQKTFEGESKGKSVYEPSAALLEIFKPASEEMMMEIIQSGPSSDHLPVIRTYWKRDLAHSGFFLLPERATEIGTNSPYIAKFSFYYEAKQPGRYGFTVEHFPPGWDVFQHDGNVCKLSIGGVDILDVSREKVVQGVCNLKKGFHRVEFCLVSKVPYWKDVPGEQMANFKVKVLNPDGFDAVPITKDMMLLKKE